MTVPMASTASSIQIKTQDAIDPGLERFRKQLQARGKNKSQQFEVLAGLLFFFLGFHVHPLSGHTRRGETAEVEKAERDDVVLLAQEELQDLWIAAQAGETSVQVLHRLRQQLSQVR